jgi:cell division protease FtsH
VKRILSDAFERARTILKTERVGLDRLAAALLERETLDGNEVDMVLAGKALPPMTTTKPPEPAPPAGPQRGRSTPARGVLGSPPPEPAGA